MMDEVQNKKKFKSTYLPLLYQAGRGHRDKEGHY
jgi:hypothetical protein